MGDNYQYDKAIVIGRFMGLHAEHVALFHKALAIAPRVAIVLGSSFHARSAKNPFTWKERAAMIAAALGVELAARVDFIPIRDYYDNRRWRDQVRREVESGLTAAARIAIVGHLKDASSEYLNMFRPWDLVEMPSRHPISGTAIRRILFESANVDISLQVLQEQVPEPVLEYLKAWARLPCFSGLAAEHRKIQADRERFPHEPYVTADSVVLVAGHVLLVQRANHPGRGLWALPGGFHEPERRERMYQCAVRELTEETHLGVLKSTLAESLVASAVFDHPDRSVRGITITHAHFFELKTETLPSIEGGDDAARAEWVPVSRLQSMEEEFFDDHFHILSHFLALDHT